MISTLLLAASLAVNPAEAELSAKLPEIFAKSAAHYKALDAAATPLMKVRRKKEEGRREKEEGKSKKEEGRCEDGVEYRTPHGWAKWKTGKDELDMRSIYWWTSGHFPGSLWYLYEATGDEFFKNRATVWTEILAPNSKVTDNHDVGFIMYCSFGNARRILKTTKYDELLVETARSLCERYNPGLGLIRSWGAKDGKDDFLVIPDNLMNLELLEWAAGMEKVEKRGGGGQRSFDSVARSHADVSMKHHFRADGGCYHVLDYDQVTKRVKGIMRGQGASCETAWSRGQSWGIYGYTMMYRTTGYVRYLDFARKLADYAMNHPNMPSDGVPYWDYGAPGEERDTSAAAVMASALIELSQYVDATNRDRYRAFAVKQLLSLASPAYFSEGNEIGHFLLKHGTGYKPAKSEIDTPLDYGDYYFLEALLRFRRLKGGAPGGRALPSKATLPEDELLYRSRTADLKLLIQDAQGKPEREACVARAEKYLTEPIPDTSDELYGEYWTTGNRTHYQAKFFARLCNVDALALAEYVEGKGRFLPKIEEYLSAICAMKSWVLPAHDFSDGGKGTFRGTWIWTDLFSTEVAAHLACIVQLLPRLHPETVDMVKANAERRVFGPVRREAPSRLWPESAVDGLRVKSLWWINCENNWNAVCWDNIVCAACGLIDDPADRAFFVASADKAADTYVERGFAADGYCSEGMGYWNYGFGHHLLTGRMLDKVSGGKFDFFRRAARQEVAPYRAGAESRGKKTRLAAAYARAYTLREGASPAFADGNGAASSVLLSLVDHYWPDLPHALSPMSEFPDGQVWLFRDPENLSVAFKGGHNGELHNHNDIGSYYVMRGDAFVAGDPGGEEYTARTFSGKRYESKVINSFGHPVPVVGGKLQSTGRQFAAKVFEKKLEKGVGVGERSVVVLDLTGAYEVGALKRLTRTFVYDRAAKSFMVTDKVAFSEPTAFESAFNTYLKETCGDGKVNNGSVKIGYDVRPEITVKGGDYELVETDVANPNRISPHRVAIRLKQPVTSAEVSIIYKN